MFLRAAFCVLLKVDVSKVMNPTDCLYATIPSPEGSKCGKDCKMNGQVWFPNLYPSPITYYSIPLSQRLLAPTRTFGKGRKCHRRKTAPAAACTRSRLQPQSLTIYGADNYKKEKWKTKKMIITRRKGLMCAGGAKTAEHLFLPGSFAPLLQHGQKWKTITEG